MNLHELAGRRFLIATHGEGNWVRNLRAAGTGTLRIGHNIQNFTAPELPPEAAAPVIQEILGPLLATQGVRGSTLRRNFGAASNTSLDDFIDIARTHPVFELSTSV